jgi:hypothetical protein
MSVIYGCRYVIPSRGICLVIDSPRWTLLSFFCFVYRRLLIIFLEFINFLFSLFWFISGPIGGCISGWWITLLFVFGLLILILIWNWISCCKWVYISVTSLKLPKVTHTLYSTAGHANFIRSLVQIFYKFRRNYFACKMEFWRTR